PASISKCRAPSSVSSGPYCATAIGSSVNDHSFTSPRMPCAAPMRATRTFFSLSPSGRGCRAPDRGEAGEGGNPPLRLPRKIFHLPPPLAPEGRGYRSSARRRCFGRLFRLGLVGRGLVGSGLDGRRRLGRRVAGFLGLGGFLFLGLAFLARDRLFRIVGFFPLHDAGGIEEASHGVGRLRALLHPGLHLVEIELEPLGLFLRQQRIEIAEPLDEAAVARRARVGDDDVIDRPLLGSGAGHADDERHFRFLSYSLTSCTLITSSFRDRASLIICPAIQETFHPAPASREYRGNSVAAHQRQAAFSWRAPPSAPGWAWRSRSPWPARGWPTARACRCPSSSSCRTCRDAFLAAC